MGMDVDATRTHRRWRLPVAFALVGTLAAAPAVATTGEDRGPLGSFSAPFAEDATFSARVPQTAEESDRTPTAVHLAMLPDGRAVYWGGIEGGEHLNGGIPVDGGRALRSARSRILDLRSGRPVFSTPGNELGGPTPEVDLFCADQRVLPDGRLLAIGGTLWDTEVDLGPVTGSGGPGGITEIRGTVATRWLDTRSSRPAWVGDSEADMAIPRWYPSALTLPSGEVMVASGVERLVYNAPPMADGHLSNVRTIEVFDPATDRWTTEPSSADISLPLYPRLHAMHDGRVLYPGTGMMWNPGGESYDEALWAAHHLFDPESSSWSVAGVGAYGARSDALSVPLRLEAPYDETRVLIAAGNLGVSPGAVAGTDLSELVTYRDGATSSVPTGRMDNARWFSPGVLLPSGDVVAVSGSDVNANVALGAERSVRQAELFDPDTGTWRAIATANRERTYHNTAILLPDGRVLIGGHAPQPDLVSGRNNPENPTAAMGLSAQNLKDPSFEILTPPYLDPDLGARPSIRFASKGMQYGSAYPVKVRGDVAEVVLVRLPSMTHVTDGDQRAVALEFEVGSGGVLEVAAPPNGNVAPPGYYYLFAMSPRGVPSMARIVQVGADVDRRGAAVAPFGT